MLPLPWSAFLGFRVWDFIHQPARMVGSGGTGRAEGGHDHVCVGGEGPAARQGQREEAALVLNANGLTEERRFLKPGKSEWMIALPS